MKKQMQSPRKKVKVRRAKDISGMTTLEISRLGRPWHKISKIFKDNQDRFEGKLNVYFLRKFRKNITLSTLTCSLDVVMKQVQIFSSQRGSLAFDIDRMLLMSILNDYYGLSTEYQEAVSASSPITRTEERLRNKLASDLLNLLVDEHLLGEALNIQPDPAGLNIHWACRVDFQLSDYPGSFSLFLDQQHVDRLLAVMRHIAEHSGVREKPCPVAGVSPSLASLPIRLAGALVSLPMTLSALTQLKAGDILPVALPERVTLHVNKQPLFSASIAEENGRLLFCDFIDQYGDLFHE